MKNVVLKIIGTFVMFTLVMLADRAVFIAIYGAATGAPASTLWGAAMFHGLTMDMSVAAYLTVVPALAAIASVWTRSRWPRVVGIVWFCIASLSLSAVFVLDLVLYGYWGFRLDMTPMFYFASSPASAMASVSAWQIVGGAMAFVIVAAGVFALMFFTVGRIRVDVAQSHRIRVTAAAALLTGALFIPIRGGLTVSTMNISRAYFSTDTRLNHIAVNPAFSFLYSATHQSGFSRQFRFYSSDDEARKMLPGPDISSRTDSVRFTIERPDVYIVILESFSAHLTPSLGGKPVATGLDSMARDGILFTRFYANSFRTDRSLPAILSGFPSQPTASIMKYAVKAERLPGIAAEMRRQGGYETAYYYGGDANFTNMLAYLRSTGFGSVVSDRDFPVSDRLSKWGAHDHVLFRRVLKDAAEYAGKAPRLSVIQTSSSHEPFEVPYASPRFAGVPQANAFAYTDSCLTVFVSGINALPRPSVVIMVPDHYGAWPPRDSLPDFASRHHVPLVITGTALATRGVAVATPGSQNDIAATLLPLLGMDDSAFPFSHNLLDPSVSHFAWITEPDLIGLIGDKSHGFYDITADRELPGSDAAMTQAARAWLQIVYTAMGD